MQCAQVVCVSSCLFSVNQIWFYHYCTIDDDETESGSRWRRACFQASASGFPNESIEVMWSAICH